MGYSYNLDRKEVVFAQRDQINVNFKALVEVCRAIRYRRAGDAIALLDRVADMQTPIAFKRYNKHVGARSELHGRKGRYPVKAAKAVKSVLLNAMANTKNKGLLDSEELFVVHSSANKAGIMKRYPPRGSYVWGQGTYHSHMMHSNLEYTRIEIGLAEKDAKGLSERMQELMGVNDRKRHAKTQNKKQETKKEKPKAEGSTAKKDEKNEAKVKA